MRRSEKKHERRGKREIESLDHSESNLFGSGGEGTVCRILGGRGEDSEDLPSRWGGGRER